MTEQRHGAGREREVPGVADRDQHVAQETVDPDAFDRAAGEQASETGILQARQPIEARRREVVARTEFRFAAGNRELVPRARRQAIVAAVDAVPHEGPERRRDRAGMFDREIGDAARRIEPERRREGLRRTGLEARPAGSARLARGGIGCEVERREDRAEEQPGAVSARDEVGVLADPSEAGRFGQRLLHHGCRVDEDLHLGPCAGGRAEARHGAGQLLQLALDDVVVVAMAGIDRHGSGVALRQRGQRVRLGSVIHPEHDDGPHLRPERAGRAAPLRVSAIHCIVP